MIDVPLWMLIGLPGSGKSTWARQFVQGRSPLRLVSTDQIRAQLYGDEARQGDWWQIWRQVQVEFRLGVLETQQGVSNGVVYDATNARRKGRRQVLQSARYIGFTRMMAVWFDCPIATCLARNQQRSRQVPPDVIFSMARQLAGAPPHYQEGFDAIFQIGGNSDSLAGVGGWNSEFGVRSSDA